MLFLGKRALWSGLGHEGTARMLGAIDGSRGSYASGLRAYGAFCDLVGVIPFPATSDSLIRFVALFSNPATAEQYVKHVKFAHHFAGHDISGFDKRLDYVVKGSSKSSTISKRQAPAICWKRTRELMRAAFADGRPRDAAAYGLSSLFLLRVKNELLPLQWRALDSGGHSSITFQTSRKGRLVAVIDLRSRKNARHGARLERICTCATSPDEILCPVHLLLGLQDLPHLLDGDFSIALTSNFCVRCVATPRFAVLTTRSCWLLTASVVGRRASTTIAQAVSVLSSSRVGGVAAPI